MNHSRIVSVAGTVLVRLSNLNLKAFDAIGTAMNTELDEECVPFEQRRYVAMAMADIANGRAAALGGKSADIMRKLAAAFTDQHARWAGVKWYQRRGPAEAKTRAELDFLRREATLLEDRKTLIEQAAKSLLDLAAKAAEFGTFAPIVNNVVQAQPAPIVNVTVPQPVVNVENNILPTPAPAVEAKTRSKRVDPEPPAPAAG